MWPGNLIWPKCLLDYVTNKPTEQKPATQHSTRSLQHTTKCTHQHQVLDALPLRFRFAMPDLLLFVCLFTVCFVFRTSSKPNQTIDENNGCGKISTTISHFQSALVSIFQRQFIFQCFGSFFFSTLVVASIQFCMMWKQ